MSEKKQLNLSQRILAIMGELDYIQKGDKTVNGQYRFVSHDQVTAAIHPMLVKYGVVIIPSVLSMNQEGNRTVVELHLRVANADDNKDQYDLKFFGYGIDAQDKGPGKAISYAYKYACMKLFCLETGDDPDKDVNSVYEPVKCLEFDSMLPEGFSDKEQSKLKKFLEYSSKITNKHVEEVKREAIKRMPEFLQALKKWKEDKTSA